VTYLDKIDNDWIDAVGFALPDGEQVSLRALLDEVRGMAGLTLAEHDAIHRAGRLYSTIAADVIGFGPTREADLAELRAHIHGIQRMLMAQAAAREYPKDYRLLGDAILKPAGGGELP
jgi:hypothetical protein